MWCIAKPGATNQALQQNLDYVCSQPGVDCGPIQPGGTCFSNDIYSQASYAMNAYYQKNGHNDFNCDFSQTGLITSTNPSTIDKIFSLPPLCFSNFYKIK